MCSSGGCFLTLRAMLGITNPIATFIGSGSIKTGTTTLPQGVIHVFREVQDKPNVSSPTTDEPSLVDDGSSADGIVLAVLAVPPHMTPTDFLNFVAPAAESILHLRMIKWARLFGRIKW